MAPRTLSRVYRGTCAAVLAILLALASQGTAVRAADPAWRGEYFTNPNLVGNPAIVRSDREIRFDWGLGAPAAGIPADFFSARWTRSVYFPAGQWRFSVTVDDGVRLWVDGQLIIDEWHISAPITYSASVLLGRGDHSLRVEYFENTERAQIRVWWDQQPVAPTPTPTPFYRNPWRGEYFDNRNLSGNPRFVRDDAAVYFNWNDKGPGGGIPGYDFSVRWTTTAAFDRATYEFRVKADDGVRLWVDDNLLIDEWHDSALATYTAQRKMEAGNHNLRLEYYQAGGAARVEMTWQRTDINWVGNLYTCMRVQDSWVKVYRLTPNGEWEDMRPEGYGAMSPSGEIKIDGLPIDAYYGWDGQPYKAELWIGGKMVASQGDIFAGQPAFRITPGQDARTSWPCGAALRTQGHGPPEH